MKSFNLGSAVFALAFAILLFIGYGNASAQSVNFTKLELKHNQKHNGRDMLQFWYNVNVSGIKGHKIKVCMFIDTPKGVGHKFADGRTMQKWSNELTCTWDGTHFYNTWIGFYNDELNPLPGKRTYYTRLFVWDLTTNKWIGNSEFLTYDMTGKQMTALPVHEYFLLQNKSKGNNLSSKQSTVQQQSNTPQRVAVKKPCEDCYATGFRFLYWRCFHEEKDAEEVFCNACKTTHCSKCTDHKQCPMCLGRGYENGKACTLCNATGLEWRGLLSCRHHTKGTVHTVCSICKMKHCSECTDLHEKCFYCNGTGYKTDYEYR